mgnify:CR=1 FL=1
MSVIDQLAFSIGRRDEVPNVELAQKIAATQDKQAVKELAQLLTHKKKDIRHDSIKVLYEVGAIEPALIKDYLQNFLAQLKDKNNRMVWGAMIAIDAVSAVAPEDVYEHLTEILDAGEKGSVITKDGVAGVLVKLSRNEKLVEETMPLLFEHLMKAAPNQFPMYAEKAMPVVTEQYKKQFISILNNRMSDLEKDSQKKRVEKLLKKLNK